MLIILYVFLNAEPEVVVSYLHDLKSSEEALRDQLEKAKKKEAAFIVTIAKREQEIADLKVHNGPYIYSMYLVEW